MPAHLSVAAALNTLSAGLVLISAFAMVATRQVQGVIRFFIIQSLLLSASCFLLGSSQNSYHLYALGTITVVVKVIVIPWVLKHTLAPELYVRREIDQSFNIPASLLVALFLAILSFLFVSPITALTSDSTIQINLPIGLAGVLIGAFSLVARREAIPQLIGILAMENGAFFAGIAIAAELPLIAELTVAFNVILITVIIGLLARRMKETIGSTEAAALTELKEEPSSWR